MVMLVNAYFKYLKVEEHFFISLHKKPTKYVLHMHLKLINDIKIVYP